MDCVTSGTRHNTPSGGPFKQIHHFTSRIYALMLHVKAWVFTDAYDRLYVEPIFVNGYNGMILILNMMKTWNGQSAQMMIWRRTSEKTLTKTMTANA